MILSFYSEKLPESAVYDFLPFLASPDLRIMKENLISFRQFLIILFTPKQKRF